MYSGRIEASRIEISQAKAGDADWPALLAEETWYTAAETVTAGLADRVDVIPDAGEAATVGEEEPVIVVVPLEGEDEDSAHITRIAAFARTPKLPSSSEPGDPNQKEALTMSDTIKAGLRERLGVTDAAASDETLLAALDQALEEQADVTPPAAALPEGTVAIDATVLAELQSNARMGAEARAEQDRARRDGIVATALQEGRITAASRDAWRAQLDTNEEGTTTLLNSLAKNAALPVQPIGKSDGLTSAEDALYNEMFNTKKDEVA